MTNDKYTEQTFYAALVEMLRKVGGDTDKKRLRASFQNFISMLRPLHGFEFVKLGLSNEQTAEWVRGGCLPSAEVIPLYLEAFATHLEGKYLVPKTESPQSAIDELTPEQLQHLDKKLDDFKSIEISVRTDNCLKNSKVVTLRDLVSLTEVEILRIPNFGRKSLGEINKWLKKEFGEEFYLGMILPIKPLIDGSLTAMR